MSESTETNETLAKKADEQQEQEVQPEAQEETNAFDKVQAEAEEFKNKFYYLAAEMDNLRKRHEREREQLIKFGNEKVLSGLLDVVDNLERTLVAIESDDDTK